MHSLLVRLLDKRGLKSKDELDADERKDFDQWSLVLSREEMTIEDVKNFLTQQIELIEMKWRDHEVDTQKKNDLLPYHTAYKALYGAINGPARERSAMEVNLLNIINQ